MSRKDRTQSWSSITNQSVDSGIRESTSRSIRSRSQCSTDGIGGNRRSLQRRRLRDEDSTWHMPVFDRQGEAGARPSQQDPRSVHEPHPQIQPDAPGQRATHSRRSGRRRRSAHGHPAIRLVLVGGLGDLVVHQQAGGGKRADASAERQRHGGGAVVAARQLRATGAIEAARADAFRRAARPQSRRGAPRKPLRGLRHRAQQPGVVGARLDRGRVDGLGRRVGRAGGGRRARYRRAVGRGRRVAR